MKKTESVADFLARGGKITTCPTRQARGGEKKSVRFRKEKDESQEKINYDVLPAHLKISLGIKC